ncbi:MAG: TolC family protein [Candidatus Omnitrophota bacterium]
MIKKPIKFSFLVIYFWALTFITGCCNLKAPSNTDEFWTPPKWEKTTKSIDRVWQSVREQKFDLSKPLTLAKVINITLKNNPALRQAMDNAVAAHARVKQAEGTWYPQVTATGDFTKDRKFANLKDDSYNTRSYGGKAEANLLALDFGGRAASVKEAYHELIAANYEFNQQLQDVILDAEKFYYTFYSAKSSLEAAEDNTADAEVSFYVANEKLQTGISSRLDMLQAKSNYEQSLFEQEEAKGDVKSAKADLAEIMGLPADIPLEIAFPSWKMPVDITEKDVTELIDMALKKRPDIAASRANLRAKEAAVRVTDSDLMPELKVGGTAEKDWTQYFGDNKAFKHFYEYTGFLKLSWNVFDGFENYAEKKEAEAQAKVERVKLMQDELAASADVWTQYYTYETAVSKLKFSKAFLKSSSESYDLALTGYKAGLKGILDLLQAQSQLSDARSKVVQSRKDLYISLVELAHATGSIGIKGSEE